MSAAIDFPMRFLMLISTILFAVQSGAVPLTDALVRSAKRIVVMPGTFDPVNTGHVNTAELALNQGEGTLVVILPTARTLHKQPLPFEARVELIHSVLGKHPGISYPIQGIWKKLASEANFFSNDLIQHLQDLNPSAKLFLVIGQDVAEGKPSLEMLRNNWEEVLVSARDGEPFDPKKASVWWAGKKLRGISGGSAGISSSALRKILHANLNLYWGDLNEPELNKAYQELLKLAPESVAHQILTRGLYLGRLENNKITPFGLIKKWFLMRMDSLTRKLRVNIEVKSFLVKALRKDKVAQIEINGKTIPVLKYLGSGLTADAYLIEIDGSKLVAKIPKNADGKEAILRSVTAQLLAQLKFGIHGPQLIDYSTTGEWMLSEYIDSVSVTDHLKIIGPLWGDARQSLNEMHRKISVMQSQSLVTMDFAPDNIVLKNGVAYLVDMGPLDQPMELNNPSDYMLYEWENKIGAVTPACKKIFSK